MENIKIKITKEQDYLFRNTGNLCISSNGDIYMNIPYWLKETDEKYVYEYLTTEQLPDYIRNGLDFNKHSEKDLKEAFYQGWVSSWAGVSFREAIDKWFEKFKNK
jgi:hypothetical protein